MQKEVTAKVALECLRLLEKKEEENMSVGDLPAVRQPGPEAAPKQVESSPEASQGDDMVLPFVFGCVFICVLVWSCLFT